MKRTISVMLGKGSVNHNSRQFKANNIDSERTPLNISYCNTPIKDVYHELFDEALKRYNEKQTRSDRKIDDYYEKIRTGKQEKLFYEAIFRWETRKIWLLKRRTVGLLQRYLMTSCITFRSGIHI